MVRTDIQKAISRFYTGRIGVRFLIEHHVSTFPPVRFRAKIYLQRSVPCQLLVRNSRIFFLCVRGRRGCLSLCPGCFALIGMAALSLVTFYVDQKVVNRRR